MHMRKRFLRIHINHPQQLLSSSTGTLTSDGFMSATVAQASCLLLEPLARFRPAPSRNPCPSILPADVASHRKLRERAFSTGPRTDL
jgi:hypothetical protein